MRRNLRAVGVRSLAQSKPWPHICHLVDGCLPILSTSGQWRICRVTAGRVFRFCPAMVAGSVQSTSPLGPVSGERRCCPLDRRLPASGLAFRHSVEVLGTLCASSSGHLSARETAARRRFAQKLSIADFWQAWPQNLGAVHRLIHRKRWTCRTTGAALFCRCLLSSGACRRRPVFRVALRRMIAEIRYRRLLLSVIHSARCSVPLLTTFA